MGVKTCQLCGAEKPLEEFHRLAKSKDGRQPRCKACVATYMREYHQRNADKILAKVKAWREENPERKKAMDAAGRLRRRETDLEGERQKARENARRRRAAFVRQRSESLCECGCGERTFYSLERANEPLRFVTGHNKATLGKRWRKGPDYLAEDRGYETPCWIWQHGLNSDGYGSLSYLGVSSKAHRVSYEQSVGPVPEGQEIHHLCEQKACMNPEHLTAVTRTEHRRLHALARAG